MKLIVAGDYCPRLRVSDAVEKNDFSSILAEIKPILADSDYSIVNFECSVCNGGEEPIVKCGPNLYSPIKGVETLKWAGFDCVTLANNHFLDYGEDGVRKSLNFFSEFGLDSVGGGINLEAASRVLYKTIAEINVAIINCCEHEFSIATPKTGGSNPLNPIQQFYAIKEARSKADLVLVIVHGGNEHYQLPSPRMKELYRFFVDVGADVVVNHHQHCYSGYEIYKRKPIVYGLGNFLFDHKTNRNCIWNEGYMLKIIYKKGEEVNFELIPYVQCNDNASIKILRGCEKEQFDKKIKSLCTTIEDDNALREQYEKWVSGGKTWILSLFEPYKTRIGRGLCSRHIFPSFIKGERLNLLLNYLLCEAHFDQVKYILESLKHKEL